MARYFSEREGRTPIPVQEEIGQTFWAAFVDFAATCVSNGSLAQAFPWSCPDSPQLPCGVDEMALSRKLEAHLSGATYPLSSTVPSTLDALDCVEFFAHRVSKPKEWHEHRSYPHHDYLAFDRQAGLEEYCDEVNTLLRRCGHPYELKIAPQLGVVRSAPPVLDGLVGSRFRTGDRDLDGLLRVACEKFLSPDPVTRHDALEKLWDAFERLKTLQYATNKKASMEAILLVTFPEPKLREHVAAESKELTSIGNDFTIRHHEIGKTKIDRPEHVDYLFHRLFALVWAILKGRKAVS